jgi:DNA-directed RNA polymerase I, II, and III subunit RPABC3
MALSSALVFDEDLFDVRAVNKDGKHFEKVSRVHAVSESYETELTFDVATHIYPMKTGEKFVFALASMLSADGGDGSTYDQSGKKTLADKYEYVMSGRVFKISHETASQGNHLPRTTVYASFGGLLMELKGEPRNLQSIENESRIYLLVKKA